MKNLNSNYPYDSAVKWNIDYIKSKIRTVQRKKSLPNFRLERIEIHPTSLCQYNCPFCYGLNLKNITKDDLPLKFIEKNIFKSLREDKNFLKYDPIIILAGLYSEPLIYNNKIKLIELFGKYNFRFGIYTNGESMDNEVMRAICKSAKNTKNKKPSYISFNLVGAITQKRYKFLIKKIENFIKIRDKMKAPVLVNVPFLIHNNYLSVNKIQKIQAELLRIGVDKIRYSVPQIPVSNNNSVDIRNNRLIKKLKKSGGNNIYIKLISGKQFNHCYVMCNTLSIDHRGNVYPCSQTCSSFFNKLCYGSIRNNELTEIWKSKAHKNLFHNFDQIPIYCRCNTTDSQFNTLCSLAEQNMV